MLAVGAVLAGAGSFVAVAKWAADLDPDTRAAAGLAGAVPSESTFRRVLQRLDADAFDAMLGGWVENGASDRRRGVGGIWRLRRQDPARLRRR